MEEYHDGKADSVSGLGKVDDYTSENSTSKEMTLQCN